MRTLPVLLACALCLAAGVPTTQPTLEQKCAAVARKWDDRFQSAKMTCIISPPFVVAGDGGPRRVQGYVDHTIRASADALQRKFFDAKPDEPVLILLFESAEPYQRLAKDWLGDTDVSRFGYFRRDNIMVMNVGTGTGTLVHEMVHALIRPDFPDVPNWFNEGLGSLFEQCTFVRGDDGNDIRGLVNWRLPALQKAIRKNDLRPLAKLIEDPHFYDDDHVGVNYAQARYLLMFLQESEKLAPLYRDFRATREEDPTGLKQFKRTIAPQSIEQFEIDWRKWVLSLRFE
jgi:hypothetical protein